MLDDVAEEDHVVGVFGGTPRHQVADVADEDVGVEVPGVRLDPLLVDLDAVDAGGPLRGLDAAVPHVEVLPEQTAPQPEADPGVEHRRRAAVDDGPEAVLHAGPDAQRHGSRPSSMFCRDTQSARRTPAANVSSCTP
ncbi:hypothetical protein ACIRSU_00930 [Streptomyces sp. NPDC101160]|uniref:hypothetical protein n=1 Tax=Streptomyces sp. NPDC101160 TaxID=3366118 RepID=UPI0037FDED42